MKPRHGVHPKIILKFLRTREQNHWTKTYLALIGGAILSLVGPLIITVSFLMISMPMIIQYGFWGAYGIVAAISLPILFFVAYRLKGSILENAISDGDSFSGGFFARILIVAEIANTGPRLVLWSIAQIRGRQGMGEVDMDRLVQAVEVLAASDGGIGPVKLLQSGESADDLAPLLGVLLFHDIADISKTGDRIWLSSEARRKMLSEAD